MIWLLLVVTAATVFTARLSRFFLQRRQAKRLGKAVNSSVNTDINKPPNTTVAKSMDKIVATTLVTGVGQ